MYTYDQRTAILSRDNLLVSSDGYSGLHDGKNNPAMEGVADVGPIPRGTYTIGPAYSHPELGPLCFDLFPDESTRAHILSLGRMPNSFRLHADSIHHPGEASHGCLIQRHDVRLSIALSGDLELQVVAS